MALVLGVAAVALLVASVLIGPVPGSLWLRAVYVVAQWAGPLLVVAAGVLAVRRRLADSLRRRLIELAGPALISAMPPRTVLNSMLARVFGDNVGHQEIVTALLGGSGRDPAARDTAVSRATSVHVRFERIDEPNCLTEITWSHEFSGVRNNHHYVMFATTDPEIFAMIIAGDRQYPLFEAWRLDSDDELANFVPGLKTQLDVGIEYRDGSGDRHLIELRPVTGEEVALRDYDRFIRLPGSADRQDLVIFHLDLHDLADPDHVVEAVERLDLRTSTIGSLRQGYLTWSAPHPCYVRSIVFDVRDFAWPGERLVYQVHQATLKKAYLLQGRWAHSADRIEISVDSWMLPGHAVTLLWRPIDESELGNATHSR